MGTGNSPLHAPARACSPSAHVSSGKNQQRTILPTASAAGALSSAQFWRPLPASLASFGAQGQRRALLGQPGPRRCPHRRPIREALPAPLPIRSFHALAWTRCQAVFCARHEQTRHVLFMCTPEEAAAAGTTRPRAVPECTMQAARHLASSALFLRLTYAR